MNKIIWKSNIKGYDVCIAETSYSAILASVTHKTRGIFTSQFWPGGFDDLSHAKKVCLEYIDQNILFERKLEKAKTAYDAVMATE